MSKIKERNLLEDLALAGGLDFISDLRIDNQWEKILTQTNQINTYSLEQWEETIHYLTGKKLKFETCEEAFQYLCQYKK